MLCLSPSLLTVLRLIWGLCGGSVCPSSASVSPVARQAVSCTAAPHSSAGMPPGQTPPRNFGALGKTQPAWINRGEQRDPLPGNEFQSRGRQALLPPPRGGVSGRQLAESAGSHGDGRKKGMLGCRWESGKKGQALINLAAAGSTGGELLPFSVFPMSSARLGEASG